MDRGYEEQGVRHHGTTDRASDARATREEVVEILAEALWSLICAGRGPGATGAAPRGNITPQPGENTGV